MKIKQIHIENFRAIENGTIDCTGYNIFVGPNGSGKSTVLDALNVFFGERNKFNVDDFFQRKTDRIVTIKVTFHQMNKKASKTFSHYVRNGELVVSALLIYNKEGSISKIIRGERLVFQPFQKFFEAKKASDGKVIFDELRAKFPDIVNAANQDGRTAALNSYEEALAENKKELIPSGEEFFGISKGSDKIRKHIHWVYIPAVKEAAAESEEGKASYLGRLIQHTVKSGMDYEKSLEDIRETAFNSYEKLLDNQQEHLEGLEARLSKRLRESVTSDVDLGLSWKKDEKSISVTDPVARVNLKDKGFSGEVESFGHGLQRSFLIIILQELVAIDNEVTPTLILGCEEPELYQHPPQAKHLASILMEMSEGDAQVMCSTHSPFFVDVEFYDGIKMFRNTQGGVKVSHSNFSEVLTSYNEAFDKQLRNNDQVKTKLSVQMIPKYNELFFSDKVVLVEGISDQACIEAYLRLSGRRPDFQKSGTSIVVCEGKSSLVLMLIMAKQFEIPFHVVFDCDSNCEENHKAEHLRDNNAILTLAGHEKIVDLPNGDLIYPNLTGWINAIEGTLEAEFGDDKEAILQSGRNAAGQLKNCRKYPLFVATTLTEAWAKEKTFPVLSDLIDRVLAD